MSKQKKKKNISYDNLKKFKENLDKDISEALNSKLNSADISVWAKANTKPTYTAEEVGADVSGSANTALTSANSYTDITIANLIGTAPDTLDTLEELAAAIQNNETVIEILDSAITIKADKTSLSSHTNNKSNPHEVKPTQIKKDDFVLHRGKTVAELKNELLDWWDSACGTLSVYRFSGGTVSWWLENFKNDEEIIPAGATYTVIPIADYAPDKRHATFLFSAASNSDKSNEILKLELFNSKFVYLSKLVDGVTGIKGEAETEYRTGDINISQANIGLIFDGSVLKNKTVGEAKEIISGTYLSNPDRFGIFMRVPSDLIEKWDDDYYVLSAGSVCQITPIGTVTKASNTGKLYGRFLITAYFGESPYIFDVSASAFGKINKILTSLDITPEMLEKLKNL